MNKLPDKPSELLLLALQDMDAMEKVGHTINMGGWCWNSLDESCRVCLAGAVMLKRFKPWIKDRLLLTQHAIPSDIKSYDIMCKLYALNFLRGGHIQAAFSQLEFDLPESLPNTVIDYSSLNKMSQDNRPEWINHMLDLVGILQAEGL